MDDKEEIMNRLAVQGHGLLLRLMEQQQAAYDAHSSAAALFTAGLSLQGLQEELATLRHLEKFSLTAPVKQQMERNTLYLETKSNGQTNRVKRAIAFPVGTNLFITTMSA